MGYIATTALWSKVFGVATFKALSYLSLMSHLALIGGVYAGARRWFEIHKALLVSALVAFSPLYLGLSRIALTDSFISLSQVASLWLFLDYVRDPSRAVRAVAFAAVFTLAILTKEISVLLVLPFVAHAALERWYQRRDVPIVRTALILSVPALVSIVVWILAAGSPIKLFKVMKIVMTSPATNQYAIEFGSGGWYRYPVDEILMSPWPTVLGLAGAVLAFWRWRKGEYGAVAVAMALVYVMQVGVLSLFTKNLRYVAVLEVPLRVLAVVLLWEVLGAKHSRLGRYVCTALVVLLCWLCWLDFDLFWLQWKTYDPVTDVLVQARQLVPLKMPR